MTRTFASLADREVTGIVAPGSLDRDAGHPRFAPWGLTVYFALDVGFLRLESTGGRGQLALELVPEVAVPTEIETEDDEFAVTHYDHLLLGEDEPRRLVRVRYATNPESDPERGTVRCAEFVLAPRTVIFADPMWTFGVRLSGEGAYDRWLAEVRESPEPPFLEHVWPELPG
ncbi:hypothetical protein [Streptomyces sp. NPDC127098]|uniref:hypothetical protein n=1 Tax=Streptomyces sp. NPDC127098 TaxID=3347137 RepID=UPI00366A10F4